MVSESVLSLGLQNAFKAAMSIASEDDLKTLCDALAVPFAAAIRSATVTVTIAQGGLQLAPTPTGPAPTLPPPVPVMLTGVVT